MGDVHHAQVILSTKEDGRKRVKNDDGGVDGDQGDLHFIGTQVMNDVRTYRLQFKELVTALYFPASIKQVWSPIHDHRFIHSPLVLERRRRMIVPFRHIVDKLRVRIVSGSVHTSQSAPHARLMRCTNSTERVATRSPSMCRILAWLL